MRKNNCFIFLYLFLTSYVSIVYCQKPHIIFILADDLGWNDLSFHGSNEIPTPNIDALAYNGIILNNMYAQPVCTPSRASLMTGKYPIHTGMQGPPIWGAEPRGVPLTERFLPEYLRELGYSTKAIGKWHLGFFRREYTPLYRGFESHFGYLNGVISYYDHILSDQYSRTVELNGHDMRRNLSTAWDTVGEYATDLFTKEAVQLIEDQPVDKPLFLYLAHLAAHAGNAGKHLEAPQETINQFQYITDPNRRTYAAMVKKLDDSVGTVISALQRKGMLENSIIIFMSDNGAPTVEYRETSNYRNWGSNYPYRGVKNTLWEGGVKVPAILWSPQIQQNPRVSLQMMHISDWLPTLYTAAGGDTSRLPLNIDGLDQWSSLLLNTPSRRNSVLINIDEKKRTAAVRLDSWKLVLGTQENGTMDGYYGQTRSNKVPLLNFNAIVESKTYQSLQQLSQNIFLPISNIDKMRSTRQQATIHCGANPAPMTPSPCTNGPCYLFNLGNDPCEQNNIASSRPDISSQLYELLKYHRRTLVPQSHEQPDIVQADPKRFNDTWSPWVF
ncbi:hypothetical protein M8J77_013626 [Diaphorina citri]|nr:hypothetical protein M8J77_013626 [Diaphorina citri]